MTHGLRARPRSTAFFASRPAATITGGFDVFVQVVIAAITTAPWSSRCVSPSSSTSTPVSACSCRPTGDVTGGGDASVISGSSATGSLAGNVSATALSSVPFA